MQISEKSVYITEGAIFEQTDLTHALLRFVPIKIHQPHDSIYKPDVFGIDHFMKDNLQGFSAHGKNHEIVKKEECITDCILPMAVVEHQPNVEARELAKKFNETAFLAKTPDIFKFFDLHKEHSVDQEFFEVLPYLLAIILVLIWCCFVFVTFRYYNSKRKTEDAKDAEELGISRKMYVDLREKVYFNYFIELPSIKNSMSANFNDEEDGVQEIQVCFHEVGENEAETSK